MKPKILYSRMKWSCKDGVMTVKVEKYRFVYEPFHGKEVLQLIETIDKNFDFSFTLSRIQADAVMYEWSMKRLRMMIRETLCGEQRKLQHQIKLSIS